MILFFHGDIFNNYHFRGFVMINYKEVQHIYLFLNKTINIFINH
jgi:hypothetical protein